ncbi:MAG: hypothetical protein DMG06_25710 [Acidobacteria bacterium]|nr:MAG: hypothetical protein DMG06_25710 [Acidobacteriota bacterium]
MGDWRFWDFGGKGGSDRHSCLSKSSLKQLEAGKNACRYLKISNPQSAECGADSLPGSPAPALKGRRIVRCRDASAKETESWEDKHDKNKD